MADASTFRLIYRSHNRIPEHERKAELGAIFSVARSGNATTCTSASTGTAGTKR